MLAGLMQKKSEGYEEMKTLNYLAVRYFELGMWDTAFLIWKEMYDGLQKNLMYDADCGKMFPVISCNFGNALRRMGCTDEAFVCCRQGLQCCFEKEWNYAAPELLMQLAALYAAYGEHKIAFSMFFFGKHLMHWGNRADECQTLEEIADKDFLLYCQEELS